MAVPNFICVLGGGGDASSGVWLFDVANAAEKKIL
jgi:hypothetical protein